jgi:hypothetical protein
MDIGKWNVFVRGLARLEWWVSDWRRIVDENDGREHKYVNKNGMWVRIRCCTLVDLPDDCLTHLLTLKTLTSLLLSHVTTSSPSGRRSNARGATEFVQMKQLFLALAQPWHNVQRLMINTDVELCSLLRLAVMGLSVPSKLDHLQLTGAYTHPCAAPALSSLLDALYANDGFRILRISTDELSDIKTPAHARDIRRMHQLIDDHRYLNVEIENPLAERCMNPATAILYVANQTHLLWTMVDYRTGDCITWRRSVGCLCNNGPWNGPGNLRHHGIVGSGEPSEAAAIRIDPAKYRDMEEVAALAVSTAPAAQYIVFGPIDERMRIKDTD